MRRALACASVLAMTVSLSGGASADLSHNRGVVHNPAVRSIVPSRVHHGRHTVPWATWLKVLNVHHCEEPVWNVRGGTYSGGLGWDNSLWTAFRAKWMPASMADATPLQQAWAMAHFVSQDNGGYWPDQSGCSGGY